jgi:outer membrane putative beta-barrel porin/alpha-amylase
VNQRTALAALAVCALVAGSAAAQSLEPRAYANTPVGMNFALAGYVFANGDVAFDASLPLKNGKVEVNGAFLAYARSLDVLGKSAKVDVVLPWAYTSGSAELNGKTESRHVNGLGDLSARFSINLYGAPALSLEQFPSYEQDLIVGASLQVTAPIGQYDGERLLNVGSRRWSFKPEIGISKSWSPFILELSAAGTFYTDNPDFFPGGHDRAQNPIGSTQVHGIYSFKSGIWGSLDFTYYAGGKTLIDGVANHGVLSNTRLGGTLAIPVNRWNSIKLYGSSGISARTGGNFEAIGIAWQVRWGGGL